MTFAKQLSIDFKSGSNKEIVIRDSFTLKFISHTFESIESLEEKFYVRINEFRQNSSFESAVKWAVFSHTENGIPKFKFFSRPENE